MELVLRCKDCNKPFDKASTLKRHGYYCRSKIRKPERKERSCVACAKRKIRCDMRRPACSRCVQRSVSCLYPTIDATKATKTGISETIASEDLYESLGDSLSNEEADFVLRNIDLSDFDNGLSSDIKLDSQSTAYSQSYQRFTLLPPKSVSEYAVLPLSANSLSSPALLSVPRSPNSTIRSLVHRPRQKPAAGQTANLIFKVLQSYPRMLVSDKGLPPFIHPLSGSMSVVETSIAPLTNCISLTRILWDGTTPSRRLFWKNVAMECERWLAECTSLTGWEALAAIQALSIYLLLRLDEGETEYNNLDVLLVATVTAVASQAAFQDSARRVTYDVELQSPDEQWKDWVMKESVRRLCVIYQVVNMIIYFEPAAMCELHSSDLILAPLPCPKEQWEASSTAQWQSLLWKSGYQQPVYGMAVDGDLVRLDEDPGYHEGPALPQNFLVPMSSTRRKVDWSDWCVGMDGLGSLVTLAASLAG